MFDHPLSRVYRIHCILIHLICQLSQQNAKEPYLRVYWQKNSTASLKNSTNVSALSACFPTKEVQRVGIEHSRGQGQFWDHMVTTV